MTSECIKTTKYTLIFAESFTLASRYRAQCVQVVVVGLTDVYMDLLQPTCLMSYIRSLIYPADVVIGHRRSFDTPPDNW